MNYWLCILLVIVFAVQIAIFIMARRIRKREKENNVLLKYNINSRQKAWQLLADHAIPEEDRKKIQEYYNRDDE